MNEVCINYNLVDELVELVKETPIALKYQIRYYDKPRNEMRYLLGLADRLPWRKLGLGHLVDKGLLHEWGIGLSTCDYNMPETLLHEVFHVKYPHIEDENMIDLLAERYHQNPKIKKAVQERLVYELGRKEL